MSKKYGPTLPVSEWVYDTKYLQDGETFDAGIGRVAYAISDDKEHGDVLKEILRDQRFLPGGRIMAAMGATRRVTANNCYVMDTIPDSMEGIMRILSEAAETMRLGGGVGYDFSTLRPRGATIRSLDSQSSGPLSFMEIFDALCGCISSAGHRRGAQMGVLRVDHPDIEEFIERKTNHDKLNNFNISVAITDKFMAAVEADSEFELVWQGSTYQTIRARPLWDKIMRATWDWAEPGVIFIDTVNRKNNLYYCETIAATNPCGEQPLPPYGACLLGSINCTKYLVKRIHPETKQVVWMFDIEKMKRDIPPIVRGMDNVVDRATYPLEKQKIDAFQKRRMGIGITGLANTAEVLGAPYGSPHMLDLTKLILSTLRDECYKASTELAKEKGPFPLYDRGLYAESNFIRRLPSDIRDGILDHGIRNSHLLSIAPTGTISLGADNISSGIEPVFSLGYDRDVRTFDGTRTERVEDWAYAAHGVRGRTADSVSVDDHVAVLNTASYYVDSAVSKTCNVGADVPFDEFKKIYIQAYRGGSSGCTTFRAAGKRFGMMRADEPEQDDTPIEEGSACYIDLETGIKTCE